MEIFVDEDKIEVLQAELKTSQHVVDGKFSVSSPHTCILSR
jgi:hypothetical protein